MTRKEALAKSQADAVERFISLELRARILDLACGDGLQTLELARRGYRVLGVDSQEEPLSEARLAAREERLNVHFLHTDIRQLSYRGEFDAVVSLGAALGRLPNDRDLSRILEGARKGLKSGGYLLLDMLNKEWLMRHFDAGRFCFNFETGRLESLRAIAAAGAQPAPEGASLRVYTLTEITALLNSAGFSFGEVWGGHDGGTYGFDSPRMLVVAQRPAQEPLRRARVADISAAIRIKGRRKG